MRRFIRLIRVLWHSLVGSLEEQVSPDAKLEYEEGRLKESLRLLAESTSYKMALADSRREGLEEEMRNYAALEKQAIDLYDPTNEAVSQRCIELQLISKKRIEELSGDYQSLQAEADQAHEELIQKNQEIKSHIAKIPRLKADLRFLQTQQKIEEITSRIGQDSSFSAIREAEEQIKIKKLQLQNRALLESKDTDLDKQIQKALGNKELDEAMATLREKISDHTGIIDAEFTEKTGDDPIESARRLLEAPRSRIALSKQGISAAAVIKR